VKNGHSTGDYPPVLSVSEQNVRGTQTTSSFRIHSRMSGKLSWQTAHEALLCSKLEANPVPFDFHMAISQRMAKSVRIKQKSSSHQHLAFSSGMSCPFRPFVPQIVQISCYYCRYRLEAILFRV
jgi:hypothetical protein